jgi:hypothetical protein
MLSKSGCSEAREHNSALGSELSFVRKLRSCRPCPRGDLHALESPGFASPEWETRSRGYSAENAMLPAPQASPGLKQVVSLACKVISCFPRSIASAGLIRIGNYSIGPVCTPCRIVGVTSAPVRCPRPAVNDSASYVGMNIFLQKAPLGQARIR